MVAQVRRHAPVGRYRAPRLRHQPARGLEHVARGRARRIATDVYDADRTDRREGHPVGWFLSGFVVLAIAALVFGIVIYGSLENRGGSMDVLREIEEAARPVPIAPVRTRDGLKWAAPKEDRLQIATGALVMRHLIHEQVQVRRENRPFIQIRPYLRIAARLAPPPAEYADLIPSFNPFLLYSAQPADDAARNAADELSFGTLSQQVVELLGGLLPIEDGQAMETFEVQEIVAQSDDAALSAPPQPPRIGLDSSVIDSLTPGYLTDPGALPANSAFRSNTTVLRRTASPSEASDTFATEVRVVSVKQTDTLDGILTRMGAQAWQARDMVASASRIFKETDLIEGQQVHVTVAPSVTRAGEVEPIKFSVFDEGLRHRVSVSRNAGGDYVASRTPDQEILIRTSGSDDAAPTLYASIYGLGLSLKMDPEMIMRVLRIHAYDTDFRRRLSVGDQLELFFDLREEPNGELVPSELIYSSLTTDGATQRFWRFRSQDGTVDYFNEEGHNARKFLMRKPVRGGDVRLTSGYGMRFHPLLNRRRMHTGIDWSAPTGTPILAAGNGTIEFVARKGAYGNHIRIRHANGYATTYSHMVRFAAGMSEGTNLRQGQVIGYVGSTGLSSGPHLHFEVLVNQQFVDPLRIQVPRERQLAARELADYQKERARILELIRSAPVKSQTQ